LIQQLIPLKVVRVESLSDFWSSSVKLNHTEKVASELSTLTIKRWREFIETELEPVYKSEDDWGLLYRHQNSYYINACLEQNSLNQLFLQILIENTGLDKFY